MVNSCVCDRCFKEKIFNLPIQPAMIISYNFYTFTFCKGCSTEIMKHIESDSEKLLAELLDKPKKIT